jgi:phosphatidylglycerol:prolipoprotein diacylglycerol transferase
MYHTKREGHDPDSILDLALVIVPLAVIFARIYYVVFEWDAIYAPPSPFWKVFAIWEGGLAIYGGVIGGFLGILIYWKYIGKKKISVYQLLDIVAPSLILGQAIGRWGNFVNQEAYGAIIDNPAWQWFPAAVFIQADQQYHMATFFYESIWNFLVFAFLFFYFKNSKTRRPGNVFWFYPLLYGIGRAVIEGMRLDSLYLGDARVSQWLSVLLAVVSAAVLLAPHVMAFVRKRRETDAHAQLDDSLKLIPDDDAADDGEQNTAEPAAQTAEADEIAMAETAADEPKADDTAQSPEEEDTL